MTFIYLVVFGFAATAVLGLITSWIDRKVTARVQYRVGPPFFQPFIDLVKLMGKETVIPAGASRGVFLSAPILGLAGVIVVSTILWVNQFFAEGFAGDWIVAIYLLAIPSLSIIIAGFASGNPLASLGSSREMKLVIAYELPFILALLVPVISANSIRIGGILEAQTTGIFAGSISGILAIIVAILCVQAKLAFVPFDIPEAETEIVEGPFVEYSGPGLAIFKLMKNMLFFVLPFFLIILFFGGLRLDGINLLWTILEYVGIVAIITVIRNTNPRVRIDQAVRFFWGPMTLIAAVAVILALNGL
ncbi:MAG: NADH-quinone oxidoreductase subunit H [Candidatus Fermentibacteraceae bacterium]|nr:NADH-quinone oxidoreductase subunit H [Candidatus Fermentibacteraceae bacterium]